MCTDRPTDRCARIARANLLLLAFGRPPSPSPVVACCFLLLQFRRRFLDLSFGWIYEKGREGESIQKYDHLALPPSHAPSCRFLYSDVALASKRASSRPSHKRALRLPLPFPLFRRRPDYGHFARHYKSTLDPYFMSRQASERVSKRLPSAPRSYSAYENCCGIAGSRSVIGLR